MVWYQLEQPKKLEHLATVKLSGWITLHAEKFMDLTSYPYNSDGAEASFFQQTDFISNYFKYMPTKFKHKLVDKLMRQITEMLNSFYQSKHREDLTELFQQRHRCITDWIIDVMFSKNLAILSIDSEQMKIFGASLCSKLNLLTDLTELKLEKVELIYWEENEIGEAEYDDEDNTEANIIQLLKGLHSLKYLSVSCTDKILRCVAENCKLIKKLDLYDYFNVSNDTIDMLLAQLPNLVSVNLYEILVDINVEVDFYMENRKRRFFEHNTMRNQFHVKSYINYSETTLEQLQYVFKRYPQMQTLTFVHTGNDQTLHTYIEALTELQDICKLKIECYGFYEGQVKDVLQIVGRKVQKLEFSGAYYIDLNALKYICLLCPHLQELSIDNCSLIDETVVIDKMLDSVEIPPLRNLQTFLWNPSNDDPIMLTFLLSNFPNVEFVNINGRFEEDFMLQVLDKNPLSCLKELKMYYELSPLVLEKIIENCISPEVIIVSNKKPTLL